MKTDGEITRKRWWYFANKGKIYKTEPAVKPATKLKGVEINGRENV